MKKGFTLIEVITALSLIAITSCIAIPNYSIHKSNVKDKMDKASASVIYNSIITLRSQGVITEEELKLCSKGVELREDNKNIDLINKVIEFLQVVPKSFDKNYEYFNIRYSISDGLSININNSKIYP